MTARPSTLILAGQSLPGGPADDVVLGPLLLSKGLSEAREIVRIWRPEPTAAFSRRDSRRPGFTRATEVVRELGFMPVIRPQGGQLAAYHRGSVAIDHVVRTSKPTEGLKDRFKWFARSHADVLSAFGLDVRIGELPGEYCPGEYSINVGGATKVVGSAQRITRDGWLFSTIVQVTGSASIRDVLIAAYDEIGYELNSSTIGSIEDYRPDISTDAVEQALIDVYASGTDVIQTSLSGEILQEVASRSATGEPGIQ